MRLEYMLKNVSGITNKVINSNCWDGQFNVLEGIQVLQSKVNEIIVAINDGVIKGDKGDTPNVQVGETTTLDPNSKAIVTQTGDMLNPILNFGIPKGDKGDKGDTGKATESIQDDVRSLDTTWSSTKIDSLFKNIVDSEGVEYITENNFYSINGSKNGVITDIKLDGRTLVVDSNNNVVIPGTQGATLKSVGDGVTEIKLNSNNANLFIEKNVNKGKGIESNNGNLYDQANRNTTDYIKVYKGIRITINSFDLNAIKGRVFYNNDKTFNSSFVGNSFIPSQDGFIRFAYDNQILNLNIMVNYGLTLSYVENKMSSKKVLYNDTDGTWKKPTLRQWDSIEKHSDGKYYYHKRSLNKTIIGTENIILDTITQNNTVRCKLILGDCDGTNNVICDRFNKINVVGTSDIEGVFINVDKTINIFILKSKLNTVDLNGVKQWIQNNNFNIVYKLSNEEVYECTPIDLISYDTQTNYSIECGSIFPKSTLYVNSDYGNVLSNIVRRMSQIEEDRIEDRKALIRGDFRLLAEKSYPNDFIKKEDFPNE